MGVALALAQNADAVLLLGQVDQFEVGGEAAGDEFSFDTIVIDGKVQFTNILRYLPGPLEVTRNDWIQWTVLAPREISGGRSRP